MKGLNKHVHHSYLVPQKKKPVGSAIWSLLANLSANTGSPSMLERRRVMRRDTKNISRKKLGQCEFSLFMVSVEPLSLLLSDVTTY